jgi:hypothetical protein
LPQQLRHLRGPAALAAILAAAATTHRHVYPASAADRDGYTGAHCHTCGWHSHPNSYRCAWRHAHTHRHSSAAANRYADPAAATTHGDADIAATTHGDADPAAATTHGDADPTATTADRDADAAATTADGYADPAATTAHSDIPAADQHACSVSHADPDG